MTTTETQTEKMVAGYSVSRINALGDKLNGMGIHGIRFTVATVLGWIGAMKFTAYEAGGIEGLVASSPLTSWLYSAFSLQGASNFIGTIEIILAILIVLMFYL